MNSCIFNSPIHRGYFKGFTYKYTFLMAVTDKYDSLTLEPLSIGGPNLFNTLGQIPLDVMDHAYRCVCGDGRTSDKSQCDIPSFTYMCVK